MKRITTALLILTLALGLLSACGAPAEGPALSSEERTQLYAEAVTGARSEEDNQYNPVAAGTEELSPMALELLGFTAEDVEAIAASVSLMNVKAYGVVVVMPAEGSEQTVRDGLQGFIDRQQQSFQSYLPDQYAVAQAARLETLDDGTLILVMCEGQDEVYEAIAKALTA